MAMTDKPLLSRMPGIREPWVIKSVKLDIAGRKLELDVECRQEHWADGQGRKLPIHGYATRSWRHPDAFEFEPTAGR
jgi:hypothetical protein